MAPKASGSRSNKAQGRSSNKRPRTAGPSRQQTARRQDNDGNDGDEGDDQEEEEEDDEEEGQRSEATTKGGPAASSVKRRHIYRGILMDSIKLQNLAPPLIRNELTQAGFVLNSGRVLPFLFDVQDNSTEHQRLRKAILHKPGFGAGEKKWLSWLDKYLHAGFESDSRSPWSDECSPFRRNDDNFKLTLPHPDLQYYHEHVDLIGLMDAINLNDLDIPELMKERARQEVVETLRKDARETAWDTIVGAVESGDDATPYIRGGAETTFLPFYYIQFKAADERLEVGLNQLFTDLVYACRKMKGIRQLDGQMDDSPVGLVFGSAMTPRYWELYAAWQDEDGPHIMMVARDSLVDTNGINHYVTMMDRVEAYSRLHPIIHWLIQIKAKDLGLKESLGSGERWSLDGMKRHKSHEDSISDPTGSKHKVASWRSAAHS